MKARLLHALVALLLRLPYSALLALGRGMGWLWFYLIPVRRALMLANLHKAFPDATPAWRRQVCRDCMTHFATMGLELFWLPRMDHEWQAQRVRFLAPELARQLLEQGRGLMGVGGHLGNWEVMGIGCVDLGLDVSYIVKRIHDPVLDEIVNRSRAGHGVEIIFSRDASRGVLKHFRRNRLVAFLSDQDARSHGVFVPFFGHPASTPKGAAVYALRLGVPLMFVNCVRVPGGRFEVEFLEVPLEEGWSFCDEHVAALTARYTALLEERVRRTPEQWFWMHRRWKTQPES